MAVTFLESGTDATQGVEFYTSTSGTVASDTTQSYSGTRALKCTSGAAGADGFVKKNGVLADAGTRINLRLRITDAPTTYTIFIFCQNSAESANMVMVRVTAAGVLEIIRGDGVVIATGSTISTARWYRIAFCYTITSLTINEFRLHVDGALVATATNATLNTTGTNVLAIGTGGGNVGNLKVYHFDDIYIDNSSALTDPGDIRVLHKRPFANGTLNSFGTQISAGSSGYGSGHALQVNEIPLSTTNGWSTTTTLATEEFTLEKKSQGDNSLFIRGTILDYMGWIYANASTAVTGSIVINGVSSNISLTTTNTMFIAIAGSTNYPIGGDAIGITTSASAATTSLYEAGILFAVVNNNALSSRNNLRPRPFGPGIAR